MPVRVFDSVRARAVTVLTILALVVPLVPVRADDTAPAPKPFDVIDRAIARWQARPRPTLLSYTVDFTGSHGAKTYRRVFRVDYTVPTHDARITMLGSEGQAPAFVEPEKQRLSPTETFGFVSRDHALLGVTQITRRRAAAGDRGGACRGALSVRREPRRHRASRSAAGLSFGVRPAPKAGMTTRCATCGSTRQRTMCSKS